MSNRLCKKWMFLAAGVIMLALFGKPERAAADTASELIVPMTLLPGEENSTYNLNQINEICEMAAEDLSLVIRIAEPGTYYVGANNGGRAIRLRTNVTLDLNGSTLIREGLMNNLIQCYSLDGTRTAGGYSLCHDIAVKNGTLDGTGGEDVDVNLVNIGHAKNVTFENLVLKNVQGGHLIELSGCSDVTITGCMFGGHQGSTAESEAIQLDISYNGAGSWNGAYTLDGTVCRNIVVTDCIFNDFPTGVGNHHTLADLHHNENITITNNIFLNQGPAQGPAICAYGFDRCRIENNRITGNYTHGILVNGGQNVTVSGNEIGTQAQPLGGNGISVIASNSYVMGQGKTTAKEPALCKSIRDNTVYVTGSSQYGIFVSGGSLAQEIIGNTLFAGGADAIRVTGEGSRAEYIGRKKAGTGNQINAGGWGIAYGAGAKGVRIVGNTVTSGAAGDGIQIASGSRVQEIGAWKYPNKLYSTKGNGIVVTGAASVDTVAYNQIYAKNGIGILLQKEGVSEYVERNTIKAGSSIGISVTLQADAAYIEANTVKGYTTDGISVSEKAKVAYIRGNTIADGTGAGIYVAGAKITGRIQKNQIRNCKGESGSGIWITRTGAISDIRGNTITKNAGYAILIDNPALEITFKNNTMKKNKLGRKCLKREMQEVEEL